MFKMSNDQTYLEPPGMSQDLRPRIGILDHTASMSGGEIALLNFITRIDRSRFDPVVVLFSDGPLREKITRAGCRCILFPLSASVSKVSKDSLGGSFILRVPQVWKSMVFMLRLAALLKREQFDLIHTNSLKSDILGGVAARISGIPVIWHVRDRIETDYLPAMATRIFRLLARFVPNCVIANSVSTLNTLQLANGTEGRQVRVAIYSGFAGGPVSHVVHDGTPCKSSGATEHSTGQNAVVGLVGRLTPWKGQHIFIRAAAEVLKKFPLTRFQIIGSALFGESEYEREIRALTERLGISGSVEFMGFRTDVSVVIANLTVLVHASTTGEPFGQVIVEGMAAGKPIVATNGGGVPEIVVDGETGILVPMGDADMMTAAICRLLHDPSMAERMGAAGAKRAHKLFTIERTVHNIEQVYDLMLSREPATGTFAAALVQ
jgi:glycosyltransferase involved in cell wall biosynthesis